MSLDLEAVLDDLRRDEGCRLKPYRDTVGKLTIGYGRNLDDVGLRLDEADYLLRADLAAVCVELDRRIPWWRAQTTGRQRALANMAFNMGVPRLLGFRRMLAHLEADEPDLAAIEALDSTWARQVGDRARRVADHLRRG